MVPGGQRFSTRCALWWSEMYRARGQYKEAAGVYFRSGTEVSTSGLKFCDIQVSNSIVKVVFL